MIKSRYQGEKTVSHVIIVIVRYFKLYILFSRYNNNNNNYDDKYSYVYVQ